VEFPSDEALLGGVVSGSDELTLAFVRRFQSQVYGIALALSSDGRRAEDIACETFRLAARRAQTHDGDRSSVGEWLAALTLETALKPVRTRRLRPRERAASLAAVDAAALGRGDDDRRTGRNKPGRRAAAAMYQLEAEGSRAVILAGIGGLTAAEVASVEGIPLATAKTRIRTAMHRLRVLLTEA
jgi:RNA polymerase sigma-70 factor (ECF subfamily)